MHVHNEETDRHLKHVRSGIFEEWKRCWSSSGGEKPLKQFEELFCASYQKAVIAKEVNKKWNYRCKYGFILNMAIWCFVIPEIFIFWCLCTERSIVEATRARYSLFQQKMEMEMLKFVSKMSPYHTERKQEIFARRIMALWEKNREKFNWNMEEKGKNLADALKYWKWK